MPGWIAMSERSFLARFDDEDMQTANARARAVHAVATVAPEVEDSIVGARSVLVVLHPDGELGAALMRAPIEVEPAEAPPGALHTFDVVYDGMDLDELARLHGIAREEVVSRHSAREYVVGFIGFSPGFPYLIGLDPALRTARLVTPRTKVPAGSVAIGGPFSGIYPDATPGGWRLIGRIAGSVRLFDASQACPALLGAGDRVRFSPA